MRFLFLAPVVVLLAACGGGGDGGGGNERPTASFTATPTSGQAPLTVALDASASRDPDGSIASYSWNFGDNSSGTGVATTHVFAAAGTFTVTLTVTDNQGATATASRTITATAGPPPPDVQVSGRITFQRVPFDPQLGGGLNYPGTFEAPAREIEVELIPVAGGTTLSTLTDTDGRYAFTAPPLTDVRIRAKARTCVPAGECFPSSAGKAARWDIRVLNNTNSNALYVLDSSVFNTGVADVTRNLTAATGWSGGFVGEYLETRAAAPFAILDTLQQAARFVIDEGSDTVQLPALDAYWSPSNRPSTNWNPAAGDIQTTQYVLSGQPGIASGIYVLGAADNDTDEFDQHVVAHEFYHYLEHRVGRIDNLGGSHALDERLDQRVAFSEGFGNAFAGMVLADPVYRDSYDRAQTSDFHFSLESGGTSSPGWYNEASVHLIVWDLFDADNEPGDIVTLGYAPMFDVFRNELRDGAPRVSLFPFITALKQRPGVPVTAVDARVQAEGVPGTSLGIDSVNMDAYATTETHSGVAASSGDLVLPVYSTIDITGAAVRLCADSAINVNQGGGVVSIPGSYNKLGNRRLLRFSVATARQLRIRVSCPDTDATCLGTPTPDPDFVLTRGSETTVAEEATPRVEELVVNATSGDHVLEIYDYSHVNLADVARRGRTCMTVTIGSP